MRPRSGIAVSAGRIGAQRPVLVAGVTGVVPQRVRPQRVAERIAEASVGRLDEDGADVDAAVGHDAAVMADELPQVEAVHHLRRDPLLVAVAALPALLRPDAQGRYHLDA